MGLEEGDSAKVTIIVTTTATGIIELTSSNATTNNPKYVIGSNCYIDLDN